MAITGGWQTIDTAPRDGTRIEVRGDDGQLYICEWWTPARSARQEGGDASDYEPGFSSIDGYDHIEPTHWRPLPVRGVTGGEGI